MRARACVWLCEYVCSRACAYSRAYERTRVRFVQTVKVTIVLFPSWCFRSQSFNRWRCNEKKQRNVIVNYFFLYNSYFLFKIKILFCFVNPHSSFSIVSWTRLSQNVLIDLEPWIVQFIYWSIVQYVYIWIPEAHFFFYFFKSNHSWNSELMKQ